MRYLIHFTGLLFFLSVFSGCSVSDLKKEVPAVNEVPANTKLRIILPEDHTTGYVWQLQAGYDQSVIQHLNEVWHGNKKGIYFHLKSLAAGQTTLTFVSRKYRDTAEVKEFIVRIRED